MLISNVAKPYTYDTLGQLVRVDDGQEGATWEYEYDQGGNILSKKKYVDGVLVDSKTFTYGNPNWRDQLTAVNGVAITYDAIGNPLNDGEWTYTWQNGRQLASMTNGTTTASFVYNENGLRVQKTVNGVVTDYTLHGKSIVHMKTGSDELHFFYDASNKPAVVVYNGVAYSYVKNLQGDIVAILNSAGAVVVSYVYDAWGKPISTTGSMATTLGEINPFRYRGYVFDETGLYYLRSRYYIPNHCRFPNADSVVNRNLYAYCHGNPIKSVDLDGCTSGDAYPGVYTVVFDNEQYQNFIDIVKETHANMVQPVSDEERVIKQIVGNPYISLIVSVGGVVKPWIGYVGIGMSVVSLAVNEKDNIRRHLLGMSREEEYASLNSMLSMCWEQNTDSQYFAVHIYHGLDNSDFIVVPYMEYPSDFSHYNSNPLYFDYRADISSRDIALEVVNDIIYAQMGIELTPIPQKDFPIIFNPYAY